MTATATETPETTEQTVTGPPEFLGEFEKMAWERLASTIEAHNAETGKLKAVSGDPQELLEALRVANSDDPNVQAAQAAVTEADRALNDAVNALDALLKPQAEAMQSEAAAQVEAITSKVDELYKTIKAGQNYLKGLVSNDKDPLAGLPEVKRVKAGNSGSGGSGQKRLRGFDFYVNGKIQTIRDAQGVERSNLAAAAKAVGCETNALRGAFYQAMGTEDAEKFKDEVKFAVKHGDNTYEIYARKHVDEAKAGGTDDSPAEGETAA